MTAIGMKDGGLEQHMERATRSDTEGSTNPYEQAIRDSIGTILSPYAAGLILERAKNISVSATRTETGGRLISAAPELLAALDRIVQLNDKLPEEHPSRLSHGEYAQACAAIKKARGQ